MGLEISDHEVDGGDHPLTKRLEFGQKSLLKLQHAGLGHSADFELVFGLRRGGLGRWGGAGGSSEIEVDLGVAGNLASAGGAEALFELRFCAGETDRMSAAEDAGEVFGLVEVLKTHDALGSGH